LSQVVESGDPLVDTTEGVTDELGELWVAAMDPSSWGDTVGLVLEFTWVELIELTEDSLLEEFRVEGGDTVDGVGADDDEVGHSDFLWPSFLDQGHSLIGSLDPAALAPRWHVCSSDLIAIRSLRNALIIIVFIRHIVFLLTIFHCSL
jgi:hypothetical protein